MQHVCFLTLHLPPSLPLPYAGVAPVLQLALSPLLLLHTRLAAVLSCVLYATGISHYLYITFLGYSALPFLEHTEVRHVCETEGKRVDVHAGGRACAALPQRMPTPVRCTTTRQVFLYPIAASALAVPLALLFGFNPTKFMLRMYYGYRS